MNQSFKINTLTNLNYQELAFAKQCGFEGAVLPFNTDYDLIFIDDCKDSSYINELAIESGLDEFVFVDFINKQEKVYNISDVA